MVLNVLELEADESAVAHHASANITSFGPNVNAKQFLQHNKAEEGTPHSHKTTIYSKKIHLTEHQHKAHMHPLHSHQTALSYVIGAVFDELDLESMDLSPHFFKVENFRQDTTLFEYRIAAWHQYENGVKKMQEINQPYHDLTMSFGCATAAKVVQLLTKIVVEDNVKGEIYKTIVKSGAKKQV